MVHACGSVANLKSDFMRGLTDVSPMLLAYAPIAALWGAVAAAQGLSPFEAILMSSIIYSGAAQFVALDLLKVATPLPMIAFTIATVGLRHVLMSASLSRHIAHFSRGKASVLMFWLTDEAWAMVERKALTEKITPAYYFGVAFPLWPNWVLFAGIGALLGSVLGDGAAIGLDFAFAALFISVLASFWKGPRTGAVLAVSALAACVAKHYLPGAWYILTGGAAGIAAAVISYRAEAEA
jgi:4-azaleucine resistance transporter AzlC